MQPLAHGSCRRWPLALWRFAVFPSSQRRISSIGEGENATVMTAQAEPERSPGSSLHVALSNAIVGFLREYTGRGPIKARTSIRENVVLVMLEQTLTKGEQVLVKKGRSRTGAGAAPRVPGSDARGKQRQGG